jgi:hypothetical protein
MKDFESEFDYRNHVFRVPTFTPALPGYYQITWTIYIPDPAAELESLWNLPAYREEE